MNLIQVITGRRTTKDQQKKEDFISDARLRLVEKFKEFQEKITPPGSWAPVNHQHLAKGCCCLSDWVTTGYMVENENSVFCDETSEAREEVSGACGDLLLSWNDAVFLSYIANNLPQIIRALDE